MSTRRNFLKAAVASNIAFCSCTISDAARAQSKPSRLTVKVGGKRVVTIDVHSHCYFHELKLMGDAADKVLPPVKGVPEHFIVVEQRLKEMDAMAIDMEILSINPFWYSKDRDTAAAIVRLQNDKLAELFASRPERFGAFASLSLQFPDLAVQELETAIKKQGLRGAAIGGQRAGRGLCRSQIPSRLGQGRRTRRRPVYSSGEDGYPGRQRRTFVRTKGSLDRGFTHCRCPPLRNQQANQLPAPRRRGCARRPKLLRV
jgi:hypothetical protein